MGMNQRTRKFTALLLLIVAAQANAEDTPLRLEEVIVHGDKLERSKFDISTSVAMLDDETLERSTIDDIYEAFGRIANVNADFGKHGGSGGFVIRGISNTGLAQNTGTNAPLATIYLDQVPLARSAARSPLDFWDMSSLEAFRGPQSTNQGKNALAGAIHLRTRDPHDDLALRVRTRHGSDNYRQDAGALNLPLVAGFKTRIASRSERGDGEVKNITTGESGSYFDNEMHRAKLGWSMEDLPFSAVISYTENSSVQGQPQLVLPHEKRQSSANDLEELRLNTDLASAILNWQASEWLDITFVAAQSESTQRQFDDWNGDERDDGMILNHADEETGSQELRFAFNHISLGALGSLRGVIGAYASQYDIAGNTDIVNAQAASLPGDLIGVPVGVVDVKLNGTSTYAEETENTAMFAEVDWIFLERWTLTLGIREDQESLDFNYFTEMDISVAGVPTPDQINDQISDTLGPDLGLPPDSEGISQGEFTAVLPKAALSYGADTWRIGISFQEAYRSGGVSANLSRGTFVEFDPEYTETSELFWRSEFLDRRLLSSINFYYTDWFDQQVPVQLSEDPNDIQTENAGRSVMYGLEFETEIRFNEQWRAFGNWGHSITEFKEFQSSSGDLSGNVFPNAPKNSGSIGVSFEHPSGFYAQFDANYTQESYRLSDNREDQSSDSRTVLNGRMGFRLTPLEFYVAGRNLTDEFYLTQRSFSNYAIAGEGQTVMFGLDVVLGEP